MRQLNVRIRLILASIFLFGVLIGTSYLQTILHFNTYLALVVCLIDTVASALILFGYWE